MKQRILTLGRPIFILLAALSLAAAFPQEPTPFLGEWKGAVDLGMKLDLVFHFYRGADGAFAGAMDVPGRNAFGQAVAGLKAEGRTVSFSLPMGAVLKGTLDESGKTMAMTWSMNGRDVDFVLAKTASGENYTPPVEAPADLSKFSGPYLGQKPPGTTPEPFNVPSQIGGPVFSPDGNELIFRESSGRPRLVISRLENGRWTEPRAAGFSGGDLNYSPDGRKLFFVSNDPLQKDVPLFDHLDLWVVQRTETGWSEPASLGPPVNSEQHECWASMAGNGNLYFFRSGGGKARTVPGGVMVGPAPGGKPGEADIYCSKFVDGRYTEPEKLGPEVNSDAADLDPAIAPDESYLVFQSNRPGGFGQMDLYISFRNRDGSWAPAVNLGDKINSAGSEASGRVSADGKYLIFNKANLQTRTGGRYWVSAKIFEELRKTAAK
mgnify:CR=1 FL=1